MAELGNFLNKLRKQRGLTLKKVYSLSKVSTAYLNQIEKGVKQNPHPEILKKLAVVYKVPVRILMEEAGYLEDNDIYFLKDVDITRAYEYVINDPNYKYSTLIPKNIDISVKCFIIEMYEKATGKKLVNL